MTESNDLNLLNPFKNGTSSSLRQISVDGFYVVNEIVTKSLGPCPILKVKF